jgi:hypothetical protein
VWRDTRLGQSVGHVVVEGAGVVAGAHRRRHVRVPADEARSIRSSLVLCSWGGRANHAEPNGSGQGSGGCQCLMPELTCSGSPRS